MKTGTGLWAHVRRSNDDAAAHSVVRPLCARTSQRTSDQCCSGGVPSAAKGLPVPRLTEIGTPQLEAIAIGAQLQFAQLIGIASSMGPNFPGRRGKSFEKRGPQLGQRQPGIAEQSRFMSTRLSAFRQREAA